VRSLVGSRVRAPPRSFCLRPRDTISAVGGSYSSSRRAVALPTLTPSVAHGANCRAVHKQCGVLKSSVGGWADMCLRGILVPHQYKDSVSFCILGLASEANSVSFAAHGMVGARRCYTVQRKYHHELIVSTHVNIHAHSTALPQSDPVTIVSGARPLKFKALIGGARHVISG
jgi:hypothetical protein